MSNRVCDKFHHCKERLAGLFMRGTFTFALMVRVWALVNVYLTSTISERNMLSVTIGAGEEKNLWKYYIHINICWGWGRKYFAKRRRTRLGDWHCLAEDLEGGKNANIDIWDICLLENWILAFWEALWNAPSQKHGRHAWWTSIVQTPLVDTLDLAYFWPF